MRIFMALVVATLTILQVACAPNRGGLDSNEDSGGNGPEKEDEDEDEDEPTCGVTEALTATDKVDVLLVIDNSGSMSAEQQGVAEQLPKLVNALAVGELTTLNESGVKTRIEFPAARSVHVGVVSTDMGVGELGVRPIATCEDALGDDGVLLESSSVCDRPKKPFLTYEAGDSSEELNDELECLVQIGADGCGLEQQLEATWKALAPSSNDTFSSGTTGHGDDANTGFLRDDSLLVVIVVSDEEDCSIPDSSREIFSLHPTDPRFIGPNGQAEGLNARCGLHADDGVLHPVARYVDGLKSLRKGRPHHLVFAAITGVPLEANAMYEDGVQRFDDILDLDAMQVRFEGDVYAPSAGLPNPACTNSDGSSASPARRVVEVAKGFGRNGIVRSICSADFSLSVEMEAVTSQIAKNLQQAAEDPPQCD